MFSALLLVPSEAVGVQGEEDCQSRHADWLTRFNWTYHASAEESCYACHQGDAPMDVRAQLVGEDVGAGPATGFRFLPVPGRMPFRRRAFTDACRDPLLLPGCDGLLARFRQRDRARMEGPCDSGIVSRCWRS
jgi:hypothetical protein